SASARALSPRVRQQLALQALVGTQPIARLAREHHVSRKFVYRQAAKARRALEGAFAPAPPGGARVLFWLPVTTPWLQQLVHALVLISRSSLRGVVELLADLFDYRISVGRVHVILRRALPRARAATARVRLGGVRVGAHDEIYQADVPVLVGADVESTYCYLLSPEEHCDGDTWGVRLLELADRGFAPEATIADGGTALRAGQALALPGVPCRGDLFHALKELSEAVAVMENRAYAAIAARAKVEQEQAAFAKRHGRQSPALRGRLWHAERAEEGAVALAADVATLARWLHQEVLAVAGPDWATRQELYDFVVAELQARQAGGPKTLQAACTTLAHGRDSLLAFVAALDADLAALAAKLAVPVAVLREVLAVQALDQRRPQRWQREAALRAQLRGRYHQVATAVAALAGRVVRASSVVENVNSRLRVYFQLWRQVGAGSLALLQFYLNHRRFPRSQRPGRIGKSPTELLTGQPHAHWLELLGYQRFTRKELAEQEPASCTRRYPEVLPQTA
ncbi:MAG TPA: hypothetical protein VG123_05680, partial [Streptosporangiaceae bacterium]|nr:hypothetical protein [Streptosporangiaceae bacterium]